jgi:hypothetical protein
MLPLSLHEHVSRGSTSIRHLDLVRAARSSSTRFY